MSFETTACMCVTTCLGAIRDLFGASRRQMSESMKASPHRIGQIEFTDPNHLVVGTVNSYLEALGMRMILHFVKADGIKESNYAIVSGTAYPKGDSISGLHELRDTTQANMGSGCGMGQAQISHIEHSDIRRLKMRTVRRYAMATGNDVSVIGWDPETGVEVELLM